MRLENAQLMAQHVQDARLDTVFSTKLALNVSIPLFQATVHVPAIYLTVQKEAVMMAQHVQHVQ